jgi:two-component system CheB/CheR fusion protein
MKKKTKPASDGLKRGKPSPIPINKISKLTKLSSAALFSTPLRGRGAQKITSNLLTEIPLRQETPLFPLVGIGASAGGLEALEQFLRQVPQGSGIAFVIVQHLDPTHKGIMPELLQRVTGMEVFQVSDRMRVKPNCVYVIPPTRT